MFLSYLIKKIPAKEFLFLLNQNLLKICPLSSAVRKPQIKQAMLLRGYKEYYFDLNFYLKSAWNVSMEYEEYVPSKRDLYCFVSYYNI